MEALLDDKECTQNYEIHALKTGLKTLIFKNIANKIFNELLFKRNKKNQYYKKQKSG